MRGTKNICRHHWASQIPTDPVPPAAAWGTTVCEMGTGQHTRPKAPTNFRASQTLTTSQEKDLDRLVWSRSARYRVSTDHLSTHWSCGGLVAAHRPPRIPHLGVGFALRCGQRFSAPNLASQRCIGQHNWAHQRFVHSGPLVLGVAPLKYPPLTTERDRTVSRRSEPSSRTALNWRTAKPLGPTSAPGCDEPTSRCQTFPSIWTLGEDQPVIPGVAFIRCAMALPRGATGSLSPPFGSARVVTLAVKLPCAIARPARCPTVLREPWGASVTL